MNGDAATERQEAPMIINEPCSGALRVVYTVSLMKAGGSLPYLAIMYTVSLMKAGGSLPYMAIMFTVSLMKAGGGLPYLAIMYTVSLMKAGGSLPYMAIMFTVSLMKAGGGLPYLAVLLTALLSGCADPLLNVFGSGGALATIKQADEVKAWRVVPQTSDGPEQFDNLLDEESMLSGPVAVPEKLATKLKSILLDDDTYLFGVDKSCDPNYGVRIRFQQGENTVDIFFCFKCQILSVFYNGKPAGGEDFDHANERLVAIMKKLFPKDEVIQGLE